VHRARNFPCTEERFDGDCTTVNKGSDTRKLHEPLSENSCSDAGKLHELCEVL
jgi:hypothetical protein